MSQPSWIGQTLNGRYQIETLLGQGGMSAVYRANDPNLNRHVAVKLIHSHLSSDKEFIQRFKEEAAAIASLRHPNIVQVYDFNSETDIHYMVLECVPGETLLSRLQRLVSEESRLPLTDAIKFALNICDALSYAHQRGMIHRDIKPANIMINEEGQAILMDFGIVKIIGGARHTATGAVLGTARYISPEVIRSEPADPRSDIYSLGITLYEMLSGHTPFESDSTLTLLLMHLNDPVPDPRSLRKDLPLALVNILLKSLEKDRDRRYQNTAEMADDLKSVLKLIQNGALETPGTVVLSGITPQANEFYLPANDNQSRIPPNTNRAQPGTLPARKSSLWPWLLGLGGIGLFFLVLALAAFGIYIRAKQRASAPPPLPTAITVAETPSQAPVPTAQEPAPIADSPTQPPIPETPPVPPSDSPSFTVHITSITRRGGQYEVQYDTTGFVERLPWMHIHFFYNTVKPEDAGRPGTGPWVIYGGPRPFSDYSINQTPEGATQICALVAHANLTVIPGSGNCVDLPSN